MKIFHIEIRQNSKDKVSVKNERIFSIFERRGFSSFYLVGWEDEEPPAPNNLLETYLRVTFIGQAYNL